MFTKKVNEGPMTRSTRPDCIRYQKLWNMHLTIMEIFRKTKPALCLWRREKITDTEQKKEIRIKKLELRN